MAATLILPTNWDPDLLDTFRRLRPAYVYGSLATEPTLRAPVTLPEVTERAVLHHVDTLRELGIGFTYVMNATCLGNREFSEDGKADLLQRFEWLQDLGAAAVVTANPYLMELLRRNFPRLEVQVSVLANVNEPRKARFFQDLGATLIHLDPQVNRDFPRLRAIRQAVGCRLSVLVNEGCVFSCPIREYHANMISHARESIDGRFYVDYCYYHCSLQRSIDPAEYLRSPWIRPADLEVYEALGIDHFKVAGREKMGDGPGSHTEWITQLGEAYHSRRATDVAALLVGIQQVEALFGVQAAAPRAQILSDELDGFLRFFQDGNCHLDCTRCDHCAQWAARAVRIAGDPAPYVHQLEADLRRIQIGSYWSGER